MTKITNKRFLKLHNKLGKKHHNDTLNEILDVYESAIDLVKTYSKNIKIINILNSSLDSIKKEKELKQ